MSGIDPFIDLCDSIALVTGGSRGIGASTAERLAASGAKVAVFGRDQAALDATVARITEAGGAAIPVTGEATSFGDLEAARRRVEEVWGAVDVLAAFAGGDVPAVPLWELEIADWRRIVDLNLTGSFLALKAFMPSMIAEGRGSVVLMASATARTPRPGVASASYMSAKGGVMTLTKVAAAEGAPHGVRVNCVSPSVIATGMATGKRTSEELAALAASIPLGRLGEPIDVAAAATFLASSQASWVTGITLDVAGGRVMP